MNKRVGENFAFIILKIQWKTSKDTELPINKKKPI